MTTIIRRTLGWAVTGAAMLAYASQVSAQESGFTWENATELSFVATGGNASSSTLGLKAALTGSDDGNAFKLEIGGVRGETGFRELTATGTPASFTVAEATRSELTAESYFARARADRSFGVAYGFGGAGWDRNTFAGVQNRYAFVTGVGRDWATTEDTRFKTDLGLTYTIQKDVDPAPERRRGLRRHSALRRCAAPSLVDDHVRVGSGRRREPGEHRRPARGLDQLPEHLDVGATGPEDFTPAAHGQPTFAARRSPGGWRRHAYRDQRPDTR